MKNVFTFKVLCFDDEDYYTECGFSFANSYSEASTILEERYDDTLISIKNLTLMEEDTIISAKEEWCEEYENSEGFIEVQKTNN